jgi:hypothetical protein
LNCKRERALIQSYVDGELDDLRVSEMEQHLDQCEECWLVYDSQISLRSSFRDPTLYYHAPARLKKRVLLSLQKEVRGDVTHARRSNTSTSELVPDPLK